MASILIIDDDVNIRNTLREALQLAGHQIREAPNGKAGVNLYRQSPTPLVISDIVMPQMDGLAVIKTLKREFPGVKIIAMSGAVSANGTKTPLQIAEMLGASATLTKPFSVKTVIELVKTLLTSNRGQIHA